MRAGRGTRFAVFTAAAKSVGEISWLAAFHENSRFCPDKGVNMFLRNYDTHLLDCTVS